MTPSAPSEPPPPPSPEERTRRKLFRFPATYSLIIATVLVFLAQWALTNLLGNGRICGLGDLICSWGAKDNQAINAGQYWRFLTPVFIHIDTWHIFVNMYSLYAVGPTIEQFYGTPRMLTLYLLCGITGVDFSLALNRFGSVGASGAIFGLVGALGIFIFLHRELFGEMGRVQLRRIIIIVMLNLLLGLSAMIDNWGHLGGLVAGIFLGWYFGPRWERMAVEADRTLLKDKRPWQKIRPRVATALAIVAALSFIALLSPFTPG